MSVIERSRVITFVLLCVLPCLVSQDDYEIPHVSIVALKPKGIEFSIPDDPKLTSFIIRGDVIRRGVNFASILGHVTRASNGFWTYRDISLQLEIGDVIKYSTRVITSGFALKFSKDLSYTVRELIDSDKWKGPTTQTPPKANNKLSASTSNVRKPIQNARKPIPSARKPHPIRRKPVPIPVPTPTSEPDSTTESDTTNEQCLNAEFPYNFLWNCTYSSAECRPTTTSVFWPGLSPSVCSGQIIFEDDFDTLRDDLWTIEEYIPSNPEYPFHSYQKSTVSVKNGILRIEPQLQENLPGFNSSTIIYSTLDLSSGCTRPGSCMAISKGSNILPPIASGRVTSKMVSFKYGFIQVRAKVPQGDWLYPDIFLESLFKKYGTDNYSSGVLRIASVLGNVLLRKGREEYGNRVLNGGPMMDFKCRTNLLVKKISTTEWGNKFHVYSLRWAPEMIALFVDDEEWGRIEPPTRGLQTRLPLNKCDLLHRTFLISPIAPFDDYFSIVLGLSAGGLSEFPDGVISLHTAPKPWINASYKARLNFLRAKNIWLPTWTQPKLLVDYIRVRAL